MKPYKTLRSGPTCIIRKTVKQTFKEHENKYFLPLFPSVNGNSRSFSRHRYGRLRPELYLRLLGKRRYCLLSRLPLARCRCPYIHGIRLRLFRLKIPAYQPYPDDYPPYDEYYGPINYIITSNTVIFRGKKVKGAWAENFKDLGDGYARDTFHAYFMGEQINVSNSDSFQNIGDGYAKDTFHVYYLGKRIDGANPDSFKLLGNGYAEDTFHTYAYGKRVE